MQNPRQWTSKGLDEPSPKPHPTNLIINYLPNDTTDEEILGLFSTFGKIRNIKIIRDVTGLCAGYGFVDFENSRCAQAAQVILNGRQMREKRLKVAFALPRGSDSGKCNLFVRYLPVGVNEEELENLFEGYGRIWSVKILRDKLNGLMNVKMAYVRFRQPADAERARIALNGYRFPGAVHPLSVQTARSYKREYQKEDGAQVMEETPRNPLPPPENQVEDFNFACAKDFVTQCVCEMPWSPSPVPEVPIDPQGFVFSDID